MKMKRLIGLLLVATFLAAECGLASAAAEKVSLTVWVGVSGMVPTFQAAVPEFQKKYPDAKVEVLAFPLRESERKIALALGAGSGPDIFMLDPRFTLGYIQKGYIEPPPSDVVDFVKKSTYKITADRVTAGDKVWGVPLFHGHILLFWNKKHFAEAGLSGPPRTWDELAEYAKKLVKYDATGAVTRSGITLRLTDDSGAAQKFEVFLRQAGGLIVEPTPDGKWRSGYNNEAGRDALKLFLDLVWKRKITAHAIKGDFMAFTEGVASMVQRESFVINHLAKNAPGVEYGIAELPKYKHEGTIGWSHALWVPKIAPNKRAAWDYILTVMKPEYAVHQLLQGEGWTYSLAGVDLTPAYAKLPQHKVFTETMAKPGYVQMEPCLAPADEIVTKFAQKMAAAWKDPTLVDNPAGIAKVLAGAATETDAILKREGLYGGK